MGLNTKITWAQHTWNPWQGCHKVSAGCKNCYMYRDKGRYGQEPNVVVRSSPSTFNAPLHWLKNGKAKEGDRVFVCSWSDFFIEEADLWREEAWDIIRNTPQLTYLLLTKRILNAPSRLPYGWPFHNVWLGVTVENQDNIHRAIDLVKIPARVRFISVEPMLGSVNFDPVWSVPFSQYDDNKVLSGHPFSQRIQWIIYGCESGPDRRACDIHYFFDGLHQCEYAGISAFVKQIEINGKVSANPEEWPEGLKVQEFPI